MPTGIWRECMPGFGTSTGIFILMVTGVFLSENWISQVFILRSNDYGSLDLHLGKLTRSFRFIKSIQSKGREHK